MSLSVQTASQTYLVSKFKDLVTVQKYRQIIDTHALLMLDYIVYTGGSVTLPHSIAEIYMEKDKLQKKERDTKSIKPKQLAQGVIEYYTNKHSEGFFAKLIWKKLYTKNPMYIKFNTARTAKKFIAKSIREDNVITKYRRADLKSFK